MTRGAQWTPQMVEQRLSEAAGVLGRLPPMQVYGYSSTWPRLLLDYSSMVNHRYRSAAPAPTGSGGDRQDGGNSRVVRLAEADGLEDRVAAGKWTTLERHLLRCRPGTSCSA